jgi:hypothetical protein
MQIETHPLDERNLTTLGQLPKARQARLYFFPPSLPTFTLRRFIHR